MMFTTLQEARAFAKELAAVSRKPWAVWRFPESEDLRVNSGKLLRTIASSLPIYEEIDLLDICLSTEKKSEHVFVEHL